MYALRLYTGNLGEDIRKAIIKALKEAKRENKTVYLLWNGVFVPIHPDSTEDECLAVYNREHVKEGIYRRYNSGELVSCEDIGKKIAAFIKGLK